MAQRRSRAAGRPVVTAEPVPGLATELLAAPLPLGLDGYRSGATARFHGLGGGAAQQRSRERVGQPLGAAPSANGVRQLGAERLLDERERDDLAADGHAVLVARRPAGLGQRAVRRASALRLRAAAGQPGARPDHLRRGEAKAGTTRLQAAATASGLHAGRRVTRALTVVAAAESLRAIVPELVGRVRARGVAIQRLFRDREFATVAGLAWLQPPPVGSVVARPKRGDRLKAWLTGRARARTPSTMRRAAAGAGTCARWIAGRSAAGRRGTHGRASRPGAGLGQAGGTRPVRQLAAA